MTDAQIGLAITTPLLIGFSVMLYRMGVLQRYSLFTALAASCAICGILYLQQ